MTRGEAERRSLELNRQQIADSPAALAERLTQPRWYYPTLRVLLGFAIASTALSWGPYRVAPACALAAAWVLPYASGKPTGFSVTGVSLGRPLGWAIVLALVAGGLFVAEVSLRDAWSWVGPVLAGIVAVPLIIVVGRRYDAAVVADVRRRG